MARIAAVVDRLKELFEADPRKGPAIADSLGVSKQAVSAWKNGKRSPSKSQLEKIAEYYGVDQAWLYGYDLPTPSFLKDREKKTPAPAEENERIARINELLSGISPENQASVLEFVEFLANKSKDE